MRRALLLVALSASLGLAQACASSEGTVPRSVAARTTPKREIDMACVERGKEGTLMASLPTTIDGFDVTKEGNTITLHRPGRGLLDAEGNLLWSAFSNEYFSRGGLAGGSNGLGSIYTCPHANKAGCFHVELWACQTSPETLVAWMREATERRTMGDAEIELVVDVLEAHGPSCKAADCPPAPHYSRKDETYDPRGERHATKEWGGGACEEDGDCEGAERNGCTAWYLRGGGELAIYIQVSEPTFCGCVERQCSWFTQ